MAPSGQGCQREMGLQEEQEVHLSYFSGWLQAQEPHKSLLDILTPFLTSIWPFSFILSVSYLALARAQPRDLKS